LISVPIFVFWFLARTHPNATDATAAFATALFFACVFALPVAYIGTVVVGLPVYLLLRHFNLHRIWVLAAIGFAVPYGYTAHKQAGEPSNNFPDFALLFGVSGFLIAIVFWWLAAFFSGDFGALAEENREKS
jgi:hypothetical protein